MNSYMSEETQSGAIACAIEAWGGGHDTEFTAKNIKATVCIDNHSEKELGYGDVNFHYDSSGTMKVRLLFTPSFRFFTEFNLLFQKFLFEDGKLQIIGTDKSQDNTYNLTLSQL